MYKDVSELNFCKKSWKAIRKWHQHFGIPVLQTAVHLPMTCHQNIPCFKNNQEHFQKTNPKTKQTNTKKQEQINIKQTNKQTLMKQMAEQPSCSI